jgi:parvulin-like peptidyl-prolyl isomerase
MSPIHTIEPQTGLSKRKKIWLIGGAIAAAVIVIFGVGAYRFGWEGPVTRIITKVLPYPAALVDGQPIRLSEYQENVRILERFYEAEKKRAVPGSIFPDGGEIRKRVLDRLVREQLARNLASRYGIAVSRDDVEKAYDSSILDQGAVGTPAGLVRAEAQAEKTLRELYGLSPGQYKNGILAPYVVAQKLQEELRKDEVLNAEKRKKAEAALDEVRAGKPFKDVALAFSEDPAVSSNGGDRGFMTRGLLPPEVEKEAFDMRAGDIRGVISSAHGYHIIRVESRQEEAGIVKGVRLQEILIKPISLDDYLDVQLKKADVVIFVH